MWGCLCKICPHWKLQGYSVIDKQNEDLVYSHLQRATEEAKLSSAGKWYLGEQTSGEKEKG